MMHELGLRILIRKIQLIAAQYEKALTPIFSYSKDHYMRVFFNCEKSKELTNNILKKHDFFNNHGPLWFGQLWNHHLAVEITKASKENHNLHQFLSIIAQESKLSTIGFFNIHKIVKENKLKKIPKKEILLQKIKSKKYKASLTHFNPVSIRSNIPLKELIKLIKSIK
jgi:tRNA (guanine26-N2/guanine27-N2)-dimethyltransferase